jgi:hypothetical protein
MRPRCSRAAGRIGAVGDDRDKHAESRVVQKERAGRRCTPTTYPGDVDYWMAVLWALLPTVVVAVAFFFILRGILRMDRTERKAYARIEAQERAKRGLPPADASASDR